MDVVGLLGEIQNKARQNGKGAEVERAMLALAEKVGLTEDEIDAVERYAYEIGGGAVVYYP